MFIFFIIIINLLMLGKRSFFKCVIFIVTGWRFVALRKGNRNASFLMFILFVCFITHLISDFLMFKIIRSLFDLIILQAC